MKAQVHRITWAVTILALAAIACNAVVPASPTATSVPPTDTPTAIPPTNTPKPTSTPRPTATPNLAATQQYESWQADLQPFVESGYLDDSAGGFKSYDDFSEDWAQIGWYKWWKFGKVNSDFMFGAHMEWSSASSTPDISGCGLVFGAQANEDHYAVVLDKGRILFMMARGSHVYQVGKTSGSGRVNFGNPAEADFQVLVQGQKAYVSVDEEVTTYTLSMDQSPYGEMGFTVLSGTNRDYGTRCKMTNVRLWMPDN
ncbi:MAG TPA: hypothetical protein VIV15_03030 [Anaerolineales bacterium]